MKLCIPLAIVFRVLDESGGFEVCHGHAKILEVAFRQMNCLYPLMRYGRLSARPSLRFLEAPWEILCWTLQIASLPTLLRAHLLILVSGLLWISICNARAGGE